MTLAAETSTRTSRELIYALHSIVNSPATISEFSIELIASKDTFASIADERTHWDLLDQSLSARSCLPRITITLKGLSGKPSDVCDEDMAKLRASLPRLQAKGVVEVQKHSEVSVSSQ